MSLVVALSGAALCIAVFDWNWLKGPIERTVSAATGRRLDIGGSVSGHWRPPLRLRFENVRFANPPWAHAPHLLTADAIELELDWLKLLLTGRVHVRALELVNAAASLERNAEGRATWRFDQQQRDSDATPRIDALKIGAAAVEFRDALRHARLAAVVNDSQAANAELHFKIRGQFRGEAVDLSGSTVPALTLREAGAEIPLKVRGVVAGTRIEVDGHALNSGELAHLDVHYRVRGRSLKQLAPVFEAPLPETPSYAIEGRLIRSGRQWESTDLSGRVGNSDLAGHVVLTTGGAKPNLIVRLRSKLLDLADLGPLIGTRPAGTPALVTGTPRLFPDRAFDLTRVDAINARATLTAQRVVRPDGFPFDDFHAQLVLENGQIRVDPIRFGMAGGALNARIDIDAGKSSPAVTLSGNVRDVLVARIVPENSKVGEAAGALTGQFAVRGRGNSVSTVLGTADGQAVLSLSNGRVPSLLPAVADLDGARIIASLLNSRTEMVRCSVIDLSFRRGIATPSAALFETESTVLSVSGSIDLANEQMALVLSQAPKQVSVLSARTPIKISGTLRAPRFTLDPGPIVGRTAAALLLAVINPISALLATIEPGPGSGEVCPELTRRVQAKSSSSTPTSPPGIPAKAAAS